MAHEYDDVVVGYGRKKKHIQVSREHGAGVGITSKSGST